jgi:hypothetical protein
MLLLALAMPVLARDLYVDPAKGRDKADGLGPKTAVQTIAQGLKLARPGDTVHLARAVYRESAAFFNREGQPGRPITLDGHGATLEGADPLDPAGWRQVGPGLYRHDRLLPCFRPAMLQRWFFVWDGRMNHMQRTSKGPSAPLKKPEELRPGEWTFVRDKSREKPGGQLLQGAFYLKIESRQKLADARITVPVRLNGVALSGTNRHLVVRNLLATHVSNDGYNIHGVSRDCLFQNIQAIDCGDDGISAHDDCQCRVDGLVSMGNSTGICDVGSSVTEYNHVLIRDCLGHDLYFLEYERHAVRNAVVLSSAWRTLVVTGGPKRPDAVCRLALENVYIRRMTGANEVRVHQGARLDARRVTLVGLNVLATGGQVRLFDSVIAGSHPSEVTIYRDARWEADRNLYDVGLLRRGPQSYTEKTFAEFRRATGQDQHSQWRRITLADGKPQGLPAGVGADPNLRVPSISAANLESSRR